jgi:Rieske Fe-S protein
MKRKEFIYQCGGACAGGGVLVSWLQGCTAQKGVTATLENKKLVIPLSSFYTEKDGEKKWSRIAIVRHERSAFPIAVYRFNENDYKAFLLRCTHQGNELNVYGDLITCSAHGSEFNNTGEVVRGPAENKLQSYPVTADNQNVYIQFL